ncbi:HNH endonuclease [Chitinophaga solisilvae]|uniref:HNH endonuclease n=1 Tax=Chitinophaga solisilvae TaxID=1233460 RepID=UPI001371B850|nr:HNH endonuclease [Chitinophaga solisilvae]
MTIPNHAPYKYLQFQGDQSYSRYVQENVPAKSQEQDYLNVKSHGSYGALLFHPDWKAKRKKILERDMHRCVYCRSDKDLQVHHRQYHFIASEQRFRVPWDYPGHLLITLCESCHSKGHNKYKVPTITI